MSDKIIDVNEMRTTRHYKTIKSTDRHKVHKKKHKSKSALGCTPAASILNLENINEILRANRANIKKQRAEGKGSWKVVPKDSCEVYKDRRKRHANRRYEDEDEGMQTDSEGVASGRKKKRREDKKNRKPSAKKIPRRRKNKHRCEEASSISSFTTTTTCMSSSEMDYE